MGAVATKSFWENVGGGIEKGAGYIGEGLEDAWSYTPTGALIKYGIDPELNKLGIAGSILGDVIGTAFGEPSQGPQSLLGPYGTPITAIKDVAQYEIGKHEDAQPVSYRFQPGIQGQMRQGQYRTTVLGQVIINQGGQTIGSVPVAPTVGGMGTTALPGGQRASLS